MNKDIFLRVESGPKRGFERKSFYKICKMTVGAPSVKISTDVYRLHRQHSEIEPNK